MASPHIPSITVQPIIDYIERRGGLYSLPQCEAIRDEFEFQPDSEWEAASKRIDDYVWLRRRDLNRWAEKDCIGVTAADEFCIKHLNAHPFEVYGNEWFNIDSEFSTILSDKEIAWREANEKKVA